jgi:hypothetical protein
MYEVLVFFPPQTFTVQYVIIVEGSELKRPK